MAVISEDLFTGADTSVLTGRSATDGVNSWTNLGLSLGTMSILSNKMLSTIADYGMWRLSGSATVDGEYTEAVMDFKSLLGVNGPAVRFQSSGAAYLVVYNASASQWRLYRRDSGGAFNQLAAGGSAPSLGSHTVRITATGTGATVTVGVLVDGAAPFSDYADTSANRITTLGMCGLYGEGAGTSTTGVHFDSITLNDGGGGGGGSLVGAGLSSSPLLSGRLLRGLVR